MKNFFTLKILDRFSRIFLFIGIDYPVMRKILQVKFTMDQRRLPTIFTQSNKKQKEGTSQFTKSLWMYSLMGLILIPFLFIGDSYFFQVSLIFGITMFLIMTSMVSDFSTVLLDLRDKTLLSTKPIDNKTISAAKLVHITTYLILLTTSITALPLFISLLRHGFLFFVLFFFFLIFMDLFVVILTALLYLVILTFFDGEKLKDIINYVQISLSLGMMIGYQILIRSFEFIDLHVSFDPKWWQFFIPPIWFAAPFDLILNQNYSRYMIAFSMMAILVPIISIYTYIKLMPSFEKNLQKLSSHSISRPVKTSKIKEKFLQLICPNKEERAFYRFTQSMFKNERKFKLKIYPSLGFSAVIPFIFIFSDIRHRPYEEIASSKLYFTIYFTLLMVPTIVFMLQYSDKYKGAWIYKTTGIDNTKIFMKAALKAFLVNLFTPLFIVLSVVYIFIFSFGVVPHLLIVYLSAFIYSVTSLSGLPKGKLPFTEPFEAAQQSDSLKAVAYFSIILGFALVHTIVSFIPFGIYAYLLLLIVLNFVLWKLTFRN